MARKLEWKSGGYGYIKWTAASERYGRLGVTSSRKSRSYYIHAKPSFFSDFEVIAHGEGGIPEGKARAQRMENGERD